MGADAGSDCLLEASRDPTRKRLASSAKLPTRFGLARGPGRAGRSGSFSAGEEAVGQDFSSKLLHLSWHPQANVIATAASNSLYLFYGQCGVPAAGADWCGMRWQALLRAWCLSRCCGRCSCCCLSPTAVLARLTGLHHPRTCHAGSSGR